MSQHTVSSFDADLKILAGMVTDMGGRAGRSLADATRALLERNAQLAQQVIASDRGIDLLQHEIEERAVVEGRPVARHSMGRPAAGPRSGLPSAPHRGAVLR